MPIPFLVAGLGVAAGIIGAGGHLSAKDTNEKAQKISQDAQNLYNNEKYLLEQAQNKTEKVLLKLGYSKKKTLDCSMKQFLDSYDKIKNVAIAESVGIKEINEISKFSIDQQGAIQLKEMADIYSSSIKDGATGAAAGAIIALAANGSLTIVGSEMALAGSLLTAGEVSAAAGIAGSALSFGAAMTPLAAVAAPVILFTGISASMKADENLEKANAMYAEAEAAVEKMKVSKTLCEAISDRAEMFNDLLTEVDMMFSECTNLLSGVIRKKEGIIFKKKLTSKDFSDEDLKLIAVTRAIAGAVKAIIDTPIISNNGTVSHESQEVFNQTKNKLLVFNKEFKEIKQIDYKIKPVKARQNNTYTSTNTKTKNTNLTVLYIIRNLFSVFIGFTFATKFAVGIAETITSDNGKVFFVNSFIANKFAVWLIIFSAIAMLIGKFKNVKYEKLYAYCGGIGISILYFEYCRKVEEINHYIIFSIIAFVLIDVLINLTEKLKNDSHLGLYLYHISFSLICYPLLFLVYALLSKFFGLSESLCLGLTAVMLLLAILGIISDEDNL